MSFYLVQLGPQLTALGFSLGKSRSGTLSLAEATKVLAQGFSEETQWVKTRLDTEVEGW